MICKSLFFTSITLLSSLVWASDTLKVNGEVVFDYRSDQVRENVNTDETNIRTISINLEKDFGNKSSVYFEFLGDENIGKEGLDLSLGEVYFKKRFESSKVNTNFKLGVMKLGYGVLNPVDGRFYKLPSYYQFMYGLPRGIDVGAQTEFFLFNDKISFGAAGYAGKSLRATDQFQRKIYGQPYHLSVNYFINDKHKVSAHNFSREYEGTPKISGYGLSYKGSFTYKSFQLSLKTEWFNLTSNIGSYTSKADTFLIFPKLQYKRVYASSILAKEKWAYEESNTTSEAYSSFRLGVEALDYLTFEVEQLVIEDTNNDINKEDSLVARVIFQWNFD